LQNPGGLGDTVMANVDIIPFSTEPCTPWRKPEPFDLLEPQDEAPVAVLPIRFAWSPAADANDGEVQHYFLEFYYDAQLHNHFRTIEVENAAFLELELEELRGHHDLYWRVLAEDSDFMRRYSTQTWRFTVTPPTPLDLGRLKDKHRIRSFPNPFNSTIDFYFTLPETGEVTIIIFNTLGERIAMVLQDTLSAGDHQATWNGRCDSGAPAASGIYYLRLHTASLAETQKIVLLR